MRSLATISAKAEAINSLSFMESLSDAVLVKPRCFLRLAAVVPNKGR